MNEALNIIGLCGLVYIGVVVCKVGIEMQQGKDDDNRPDLLPLTGGAHGRA